VGDDLVEEVARVQALALEPALDVREAGDDGVDLSRLDQRLELGDPQAAGC
jgi:hypothetical protein